MIYDNLFSNYYQKLLEESLEPNFKDIPYNQCIQNASSIEISFTIPRNIEIPDVMFNDIAIMLSEACRALSVSSMDKWDFYHPQLVYKPPYSNKSGIVIAKFFGSMREEEAKKPSDTETDP